MEHLTRGQLSQRIRPARPFRVFAGTVNRVTQKRIADVGHVYSNLMGAARKDAHGNQAGQPARAGPQHSVFTPGITTALFHNGHLGLLVGMPSHGRVNDAHTLRWTAVNDAQINLVRPPLGKIRGQLQPGRLGTGHGHDAGGILVQAMHDAGPLFDHA